MLNSAYCGFMLNKVSSFMKIMHFIEHQLLFSIIIEPQIHIFKLVRQITSKTLVNRLKNLQTNVLSNTWYFIHVSFDTAFFHNTVDNIINQTVIVINIFKKSLELKLAK